MLLINVKTGSERQSQNEITKKKYKKLKIKCKHEAEPGQFTTFGGLLGGGNAGGGTTCCDDGRAIQF